MTGGLSIQVQKLMTGNCPDVWDISFACYVGFMSGYRPQCHGAAMPRGHNATGRNATDPICYIRAPALGLSVS